MPTSDVKRGHAQFVSRSHGGTKERDGASCSDGGQMFKHGPGKTRNSPAGKHRSIDTFPDLLPPSGPGVVPRSLRHSSCPSSSTGSRCPHGTDKPMLNIALTGHHWSKVLETTGARTPGKARASLVQLKPAGKFQGAAPFPSRILFLARRADLQAISQR